MHHATPKFLKAMAIFFALRFALVLLPHFLEQNTCHLRLGVNSCLHSLHIRLLMATS